jgi:hydrogenase nickel incorporation protein HypA/HybF
LHERALLDDVIRKVVAVAESEGADRVTLVRVHLGALSHFTPEHFRDHFREASRGTIAEGADVQARLSVDPTAENADGVVVESVVVAR